jgi:hypothetical protein
MGVCSSAGGETAAGEVAAVLGRGGASVGSPKIGPLCVEGPAERSAETSGRQVRRANLFSPAAVLPVPGLTGGCKTESGVLVEASGTGEASAGCWGAGPDDAGVALATLGDAAEAANADSRNESSRS